MLDLAKYMVNQNAADFEPEKFEDHYEDALTELINAKRNGKPSRETAPARGERRLPYERPQEEHFQRGRICTQSQKASQGRRWPEGNAVTDRRQAR